MKKMLLVYPAFALIVFGISLTSCLSASVTALPQFPVTFTSTEFSSSTPTVVVTPTWSGNYDDDIATVSAAQTHAASFPRICDNYAPLRYSPDGLWLEELCYSEKDNDLVLTLSNRETQVLWKLPYRDYIPPIDFADGGMAVVHWSQDGNYAYFNSFLGGDGGECFIGGWDSGSGLFRLDLQTGNVTTLLPPSDRFWWYGFSFSPTDRRMVYGVQARDLKILDMATGELIPVISKDDFSEAGGYVWSPDGLQFVYSTVLYEEQMARLSYSVRLVDAQLGSERILLESPDTCFAITSWAEDNILTLETNYGKAMMEFDLNSNKVISKSTIAP